MGVKKGRVGEKEREDMSHLEPIFITKSFQGPGGSEKEGGGNQNDKRWDTEKVETNKSCLIAWILIPSSFFPLDFPLITEESWKVELPTFSPTFAAFSLDVTH